MKKTYRNNVVIIDRDGNQNFPERFANEIYFTEDYLPEVFKPVAYVSNFSIKYLFDGNEKYIVNDNLKKIEKGQMLVVNDKSEVRNIYSEGTAFSVFIKPDIIKDCQSNLIREDNHILDYPLDTFEGINFYDEVSPVRYKSIENLYNKVSQNNDVIIPVDFYYELAHELLLSQHSIYQKVNKLDQLKLNTRKEIYKRLQIAREFLTSSLDYKFNLNQVAAVSCMSKFHFIRSFKQVYGITPHRFFILYKLNKAKEVLEHNSEVSIKEVAMLTGYADLYSFSKQFKQIFGISPGKINHNNA